MFQNTNPLDNLTLFDEIKWDFYHLKVFPYQDQIIFLIKVFTSVLVASIQRILANII